MRPVIVTCIGLCMLVAACKVNKKNPSANSNYSESLLPEMVVKPTVSKPIPPYQPSSTRYWDLEHTVLHLQFDYNNQTVKGKAIITLKPYFEAQQQLFLDARHFILHRVALLQRDTLNVPFSYDSSVITINFGKRYTRKDKIKIYIEYTAQPETIKEPGSAAITDAKGLYFINPTRSKPNYPRQIWTQGETQSNSGWFPTIDRPNEKMTQEIYLTVDTQDISLSNGVLIYSKDNGNGTRTDYWKQTLPHAPYLAMIAVGNFHETKDFWRDSIEVNYYVEKQYAPYAKMIFGNTPEMLEFYSTRLGVDYPWEKFSQIVVREFVSGAMENTSAVIHFSRVQHNNREHLDNTWEDIIAHELFHHWFGDLVTCESWSNIPLNESFATYGEYLWQEYKYGKLYADEQFKPNLRGYLRSNNAHKKQVIRFNYNSREEMFDVVSYQKGSRILHMLRNYLGDEIFFESLKRYLTKHKFNTVEIHDLRMAFEEVSGQDLNWFFNQWFLNNGHPVLKVNYTYSTDRKNVTVTVKQTQDTTKYSIYRLPLNIDVYTKSKTTREKVWINTTTWQQTFAADDSITFTNFDGDKQLLADITESRSYEEALYQLEQTNSFNDLDQACSAIIESDVETVSPRLTNNINRLLNHPSFIARQLGLEVLSELPATHIPTFENTLIKLAQLDSAASVRSEAIGVLGNAKSNKYNYLFINGVYDSAYSVVASSLNSLAGIDFERAISMSRRFYATDNPTLQWEISSLLKSDTAQNHNAYFKDYFSKDDYFFLVRNFGEYVGIQNNEDVINEAITFLTNQLALANDDAKKKSTYCLNIIRKSFNQRIENTEGKKDKTAALANAQTRLKLQKHIQRIDELVKDN